MRKTTRCQCGCSCPAGRRCSSRRTAVLGALAGAGRHLSAEELLRLARKRSPGIGIATVYRSVKCLCGCGKAVEVRLGDGAAVYEAASPRPQARLICSACGSVSKTAAPELDRLVAGLTGKNGFRPSALEVRGLCSKCSQKGKV